MYTPLEERDFLSYLDNLKYKETMKDPDAYFKSVQIINFDMIHHQCREDPLKMPPSYYQMITKEDVILFEEKPKTEFFFCSD